MDELKKNFEYRGVNDCLAATQVCGGSMLECKYGCFGFGSCVAACQSVRACSRHCPRGIDVGEEMWQIVAKVRER